MSSPLYYARFLEKKGATVKVELSIVHPDVSEFGTDRLFAWKLLHERVSPDDDGDEVALASKYVRSVKLGALKNGKVAKKAADFFTVTRVKGKQEKDPTVVYTIEVTDASILGDIKKGDGDEVYDYVEPGRGSALTPPPPKAKAAKGADVTTGKTAAKKRAPAPPPPLEPKTYDDIRRMALEGIRTFDGTWSDYLVQKEMLHRWAKDAPDETVTGWLGYFSKAWAARGAALVALDRLRAGKTDSAKSLLAFAESVCGKEDDDGLDGLSAIASVRWRMGDAARGRAGYEALVASRKDFHIDNQNVHDFISMLARAGQWDEVMKLVPDSLKGSTYRDDLLAPGAVLAWEENETAFDAMMAQWSKAMEHGSKCTELNDALLRRCLDRGEPERYLGLLLRWPEVIDDFQMAFYALVRTEAKAADLAVEMAEKLLGNDALHSTLHAQSIGILARHAPDRLEPRFAKDGERWRSEGSGYAFFAAAGREADMRASLRKAPQKYWYDIATCTPDRAVAIEALQHAVTDSSGSNGGMLVRLDDLGERAWVDARLASERDALEKKTTRERDVPCRYFAASCAASGRATLAFAALKLPGPAVRRYSASDMAAGAASVGDFTTAWAALMRVPETDTNARVSAAIQSGLRAADESLYAGPRALPLCVNDEGYVRALIAAGDRRAVEWVSAAWSDKLAPAARAAVDAFVAV